MEIEFKDWQFKTIKDLVEAVDSGKFDLNGSRETRDLINFELLFELEDAKIKPEIGNLKHIKIVNNDRKCYLSLKYYEHRNHYRNVV